jgi:mannonate dehydratase
MILLLFLSVTNGCKGATVSMHNMVGGSEMGEISRRNYIQGALAGLTTAGVSAGAESGQTPLRQPKGPPRRGMQLAELFYEGEEHKIRLAAQIGITHAIVSTAPTLSRVPRDRYVAELERIKRDQRRRPDLRGRGESSRACRENQIGTTRTRRGDRELPRGNQSARSSCVPLLCYNWMAGIGWYRTRTDLPGRGGALLSEFDNAAAKAQGLTEWGEVSEERIWSSLEYFLKAVIPVAEERNVKMALHPDDPPLSPLRGIGRILTSAANYRRILNLVPSPVNGITFCQANFKLMGEDIAALAREWCSQGKIFFVHFRDVEGTREHFRETFHDNGPIDLAQMLRVYHECGFEGPIRPDHAPTLDGEGNDKPGYAMGGKVLAIGYMKGAMDAMGIPYYV